MEIRIVTVGKIKEKYLCDGISRICQTAEQILQADFLSGSR